MAYTQSHVPMQYVQPNAAGFYDSNKQQLCVPQQMQQLQQGTSVYNQTQQVQIQHTYTLNSNYICNAEHLQYVTSFPALPERQESPWQKVEYKKRQRDNPENLTQNIDKIKLNDYWLNQPSPLNKNRFDALAEEEKEEERVQTKRKTFKAPQIFVAGVQNIQPLKELLVTVTGDDFELKVLNGNQVKIQPKSTEIYTTIIKALAEKHTEFQMYRPKEDRSFRTILRGMRYSTDTIEIETEIEKFGHTVVNIFNIKQNQTNTPLSLFFVDLKPSKNNKHIYQIETLNYIKVKFEPPRPKRNTPQCSKCQRYGHTQAYCYHSPRCVKCAGSHLTKQCSR